MSFAAHDARYSSLLQGANIMTSIFTNLYALKQQNAASKTKQDALLSIVKAASYPTSHVLIQSQTREIQSALLSVSKQY